MGTQRNCRNHNSKHNKIQQNWWKSVINSHISHFHILCNQVFAIEIMFASWDSLKKTHGPTTNQSEVSNTNSLALMWYHWVHHDRQKVIQQNASHMSNPSAPGWNWGSGDGFVLQGKHVKTPDMIDMWYLGLSVSFLHFFLCEGETSSLLRSEWGWFRVALLGPSAWWFSIRGPATWIANTHHEQGGSIELQGTNWTTNLIKGWTKFCKRSMGSIHLSRGKLRHNQGDHFLSNGGCITWMNDLLAQIDRLQLDWVRAFLKTCLQPPPACFSKDNHLFGKHFQIVFGLHSPDPAMPCCRMEPLPLPQSFIWFIWKFSSPWQGRFHTIISFYTFRYHLKTSKGYKL